MKNSFLLFLLIGFNVACSKPKLAPTFFSRLVKKAQFDEKLLQRKLAAAPSDQCLRDIFSVELLKNEVKELEKKFTAGPKVSGNWKHLKLSDLPIPQATFLKKYGELMGDLVKKDAIDYTSCNDVPCLFNKIYETPDGVAGYVHYIWYLRMGNLLAAVNKVHDNKEGPGVYNGKKFPLSAYLYLDKELYAFWRLAQMLRAPYTSLPNFKDIYRVPQGESFDFVVKKPGFMETCGLAISSGWGNGTVILQDNCLQLNESWETGNFYNSVLHELTHQVDYDQGRKLRKTFRSLESDYLQISKFVLNELKTDEGNTIREWKTLPGMMLASGYAKTSPQENFADTLALFRVNGEITKNLISEGHWNFVSKNYFDNRTFDRRPVIEGWQASEASLISQLAFKAVGECAKASRPTASRYFSKSDFEVMILPSMLNCLGSKASDISLEVRSKIRASEPEGCEFLGEINTKLIWEPGLKPILAGHMSKYLKEMQKNESYLTNIQEFVDGLMKRQISNTAFLNCTDHQVEKSCYDAEVLRVALEVLSTLAVPEEHAQDLAAMYLAAHPLAETTNFFMSYYKSFVSSNFELIETEAQELFSRCLALPLDDVLPPIGSYFSVGTGYMASSVYNCLNTEFPERVKTIVRSLAVDDMKIQDAKEELILSNEVASELKRILGELYTKEKIKEIEGVAELLADEKGQTRTELLSDLSWVRDVFNAESIQKDCQNGALEKIEIPLRYHTKIEAFGSIAELTCKNIEETSEFKSWVETSKKAFSDKSVTGLETLVLAEARIQARECVMKYPVSTNLDRVRFKNERESCLLSDWLSIEARATRKFAADPAVKKFSVDVEAANARLTSNRRRLQLRIIKENF